MLDRYFNLIWVMFPWRSSQVNHYHSSRLSLSRDFFSTRSISGQSYKSSSIVIYDSRVVHDFKILHITTLEYFLYQQKCNYLPHRIRQTHVVWMNLKSSQNKLSKQPCHIQSLHIEKVLTCWHIENTTNRTRHFSCGEKQHHSLLQIWQKFMVFYFKSANLK